MSLIGRFIDQILPVGSITLVKADGSRETHGPGGGRHVTVKLHDRRAAMDLFRNPRLKLGELYMDGRLTVEDRSSFNRWLADQHTKQTQAEFQKPTGGEE